ncbi:RING/U-box superfamily protein [Striga asiatica]|uniref:RING-type E3 ubiquitin transferase n=1 Tax=Striga asiatica TaxID=4170 RepID=A0A5A7Q5Q7_STRAF|nr:RING/U-box superfamily protein [Striga asiatica]
MMRLQTYAGFSLLATLAVIYHAFSSRGQFYPAMVYLSTSKISLVLLLNMGLVFMCVLWQLTKKIFLGPLREAEVERLNEQSWREIMEILFAITIFRQDFSVSFIAMVTTLLLIKALHWLAQKRVEYIETTPSVPKLSHVRIVSFMGFLLLVDCSFLYRSVKYLIKTRQASVSLFFAFEYMILATTTVSTIVKYVFYVSDMIMEGQWEKKAVYTFYLELIRDLLHLTMYMCFFLVIFVNYGVPLHLIRELYETFRNFKIRVADYIRYRKITSNMNDRFPDATTEELNTNDATCIICREEMITAKKLNCGHLFHVHCLRSWLERQNTCPTCRALVVPPENGTSTSGVRADVQQQGSSTPGTSSQGAAGVRAGNDNVSQHEARLQAAAAAASIYEKSFVYPSPNTLTWSPGYAFLPQTFANPSHTIPANDGVSQQYSDMTFVQLPQWAGSADSQQDLQVKLIQDQIEFLQHRLQLLQASKDGKGKSVISPSSSVVDSSETRYPEPTD